MEAITVHGGNTPVRRPLRLLPVRSDTRRRLFDAVAWAIGAGMALALVVDAVAGERVALAGTDGTAYAQCAAARDGAGRDDGGARLARVRR